MHRAEKQTDDDSGPTAVQARESALHQVPSESKKNAAVNPGQKRLRSYVGWFVGFNSTPTEGCWVICGICSSPPGSSLGMRQAFLSSFCTFVAWLGANQKPGNEIEHSFVNRSTLPGEATTLTRTIGEGHFQRPSHGAPSVQSKGRKKFPKGTFESSRSEFPS